MNIDGLVGRMNEESASAECQRERLTSGLRTVEERIERIDVAIAEIEAEIEKASRSWPSRRPGTRAAAPAAAPTNGRHQRRGADSITAKDARYRTLQSNGSDGGAKAKVLRETAEKTFNREITAKSASNALNSLKREGNIRRQVYFWHLADAPAASDSAPAADEVPLADDARAASEPEPAPDERPRAVDASAASEHKPPAADALAASKLEPAVAEARPAADKEWRRAGPGPVTDPGPLTTSSTPCLRRVRRESHRPKISHRRNMSFYGT